MRRTARQGLIALSAIFILAAPAHGAGIDFDPVVGTIQGSGTVVFTFDITETGVYEAILTDLESPAPFTLLGLAIADETTGIIFDDVTGTGTLNLTFDVDPGRYLALVGGIADADVNIGTFGLEISNVPLPPVAVLFMSALASLGLVRRR